MNRLLKKDRLPVVLLCIVCAALFVLGGYASILRLRADTPDEAVLTVSEATAASPEPIFAAPDETPEPTGFPALVPADPQAGDAAESAPFWSQGILKSGNLYRSPTLSVSVRKVRDTTSFRSNAVYYVADIYVKDVTQIMTASTKNDFSKRGYGDFTKMAKNADSLIAISGDYYGTRKTGLVIRNGVTYRTTTGYGDVCVLLKNGEMETIRMRDVNVKEILEKDPWQVWEFGPALLDENGKAIKSFPDSNISSTNPRCCIGYFEPGHYCFVVVDGRQENTRGMRLSDLSYLMESLGCKVAFNLDGGDSAHFYWKNKIMNRPSGGGRPISDIIYIAKEPYPESRFFCGKAGSNR